MNQLVRSNHSAWKPLIGEAVKTDGVSMKILRFDEAVQRPPTFLLKFEPGAFYPHHNHPAGEEIFVLQGEAGFGDNQLYAGDYLLTAPGAMHSVFSKKDV